MVEHVGRRRVDLWAGGGTGSRRDRHRGRSGGGRGGVVVEVMQVAVVADAEMQRCARGGRG